jgi:hypothetical protein
MIYHYMKIPVLVSTLASVVSCGIDPSDFAVPENLFPPVILATAHQIEAEEVYPNRYIVAFKVDRGAKGFSFKSFQAEHRHHFTLLADSYLSDPGIKDIHFITTLDMADPKDPDTQTDIAPPVSLQLAWDGSADNDRPESAISVVEFADQESAARVLKEWEEQGKIWFAEPDHLSYLDTTLQSPFTTDLATQYKNSGAWHLKEVRMPEALETLATKQLTDVRIPVIAVLDSGVDTSHPSLAGRIWNNPSPGQSGCDNDLLGCDTTVFIRGKIGNGNSFPYLTTGPGTPCPEISALKSDDDNADAGTCQHGTHVAGLVAGKVDATSGGTCPICQVMPIKIISKIGKKGSASDSAILQGFKYLNLFKSKTNIVRVANSSFGKFVRSRAVALLVSVLKKTPNEVLVVGAAGNEDSMIRSYPAAFNDAVAVSALGSTLEKSNFSNFGPWVDVAAPGGDGDKGAGVNINSTIPGGGFGLKPGTSMASPIVAGVAGLVLAYAPDRSWKDLRRSIVDMADPRIYDPELTNNYNYYYPKQEGETIRRPLLGSGIVDANAALDGKKATGVFGGRLSRVQRGCSAIGGDRPVGFLASIGLLMLPFLMVGVGALKRLRSRES